MTAEYDRHGLRNTAVTTPNSLGVSRDRCDGLRHGWVDLHLDTEVWALRQQACILLWSQSID